ncbi:MAG: phosphoenolpyruvate--protein phosphotransferase [Burkholderiales bacterium]|nr:phosphoenolpyruvate--protein phosphotransferase [Burkholderiales bacterium]
MSFVMHGVAAAPGIAIARAQLVSHATLEVAHYDVAPEQVPAEIERFENALEAVRAEFEALHERMKGEDAPAEFGAFLDVHWMILTDIHIAQDPKLMIAEQRCNAEWAVTQKMNELVEQFEQFEDPYLRERAGDVVQVVERVVKALMGKPSELPLLNPRHATALVAHDLSPADAIHFKESAFAAFVTDVGGATSHTAIVARSLGIPAVVALHNARSLIREAEQLIVDGDNGLVIVNPDHHVLAEYQLKQDAQRLEKQKLRRLISTRAVTLDGAAIDLNANIELPGDVAGCIEYGADGVGLFRSEFLFMHRDDLPSEDEQFEAYRAAVDGMQGRPVTIRTFDLGADKRMPGLGDRPSENPALGLRAIRLCLAEPKLFMTQLRAILRASAYGRLRILVPMLATAHEVRQTLSFVERAKAELKAQAIAFDHDVAVGGMVEVPASVLALGYFIEHLDFLSIGTNDLIQYTLAIDRTDDAVAHMYDPLHPAVLKLIAQAIRTANKAGTPIAVCGEMAGELRLTRLLLGFGLRNFSMHPAQLLTIKQRVLTSSIADCEAAANRILRTDDPDKISAAIARLNAL